MSAMTEAARLFRKMLAPIERRTRLMVARALVELVNEDEKMQRVQISIRAGLVDDTVERFQQYGFSGHPLDGAEAIVLLIGGSSDHPVVINVDDARYRPQDLAKGEVCLWTKDNGKRVHLKANGEVHIGTSPSQFAAKASPTEDRLAALESFAWNHTHQVATTGGPAAQTGTAAPQVGPSTLNVPPNPVAAEEVKVK